jgi:hypothetical protein
MLPEKPLPLPFPFLATSNALAVTVKAIDKQSAAISVSNFLKDFTIYFARRNDFVDALPPIFFDKAFGQK